MEDMELLELAALAAGLEVFEDPFHDGDICYYADDIDCNIPWNPLTDDGDALRLAVRVGLTVDVRPMAVCIFKGEKQYMTFGALEGEDDLVGATRRAIVRAAAEIGKGMK